MIWGVLLGDVELVIFNLQNFLNIRFKPLEEQYFMHMLSGGLFLGILGHPVNLGLNKKIRFIFCTRLLH